MKSKLKFLAIIVFTSLYLNNCKTSDTSTFSEGTELPFEAEIGLPSGIELISLEIIGPDDIVVTDEGIEIEIRYELNRPLPEDAGIRIIPVALRDSELVRGLPLCIGWFGISSRSTTGIGKPVNVICEDGEIAGRTKSTIGDADLRAYDRSSGESNTRIFLQHAQEIRSFVGFTIGLSGLESNRIRVRCTD